MSPSNPGKTDNPYLAAQRRWDLHVGDALAARRLWQFIALLLAAVSLTVLSWAAHRDLQPKLLPYVVHVDKAGRVEAMRIADRLKNAHTRTFESALIDFVTFARRVTPDEALQTVAINNAMAHLNGEDPGFRKYVEIFGERSDPPNPLYPYLRAKSETAEASIHSVLQQTEESWEVEWEERVFDRDGSLKESFKMRGLFQMYLASEAVTDEEALASNPLGIYVRDFSWGRVKKRELTK